MSKKVFLITGASSGIGARTATYLASLGHIVYGAARRMDKLEALSPQGVKPIALDVTDNAQIKSVVAHIIEAEGHIDVLVNNAGYGCFGAAEDIPIEDAKNLFEVNVFGLGVLTKEVIPHMRERQIGRIINISSVAGTLAVPLTSWYVASKFAVEGWSDTLRIELFPFNIPVIVIQPGYITSEFANELYKDLPKHTTGSAYQELMDKQKEMFDAPSTQKTAQDPIVIAKAIEHASLSKKPKTRYMLGGMVTPFKIMRKIFNTDTKWTRIMLKMIGMKIKKNYDL